MLRRIHGVTVALLLMVPTLACVAAGWEQLAPMPEPNGGFICGAIGDHIVVAGGTNWREDAKRWLDRIWTFNPRANTWREAGRLAAPVAYAAFGHDTAGLWFAGGSSGPETHATLSLIDRALAAKTAAKIEPRFVYAGGAILDGKLYVIGGAPDQSRTEAASNACFAIALRDGAATRLRDLPAPGFFVGAVAACGGRVFVFGGARWDAAVGAVANMNSAFAYSPEEDRWTRLPSCPFAARGQAAVALDERRIYIAGGYKNDTQGFTAEAFIFDTQAGTHQIAPPLPYAGMAGLVTAGDCLYCLGGEDSKKHRTDAVFRRRVAELR
jgi:N-acetylneuraminic acid mutarotase